MDSFGTVRALALEKHGMLRAKAGGGTAAQAQAEGVLGAALGKLIALSEAYPDLKATTNFQQLSAELSDIENKIAAARRFFNNAVNEYNTGIQQFAAVLFAYDAE